MHVAHFVHRYPPALGGSEAYFARLGEYLAARGDDVTVWTTAALDLEAFWARGKREEKNPRPSPERRGGQDEASRPGRAAPVTGRVLGFTPPSFPWKGAGGLGEDLNPPRDRGGSPRVAVRRYPLLRFPARRYVLKAMSLIPVRRWQCLAAPCNPLAPAMWRDAGTYAGPLDAVHATAFPYAFPIVCAVRLARRRGVPFLLTPFLHLGDPDDPADRTRRRYTASHLRWLLRQADRMFVQTRLERDAVISLGVPADRVTLQGLGVDPADCTGGDRAAARTAWGAGPDEVVVGHLANASVEKGTVDLLKAAERAWAAGRRFRVVLAGPEMANFRTYWGGFTPKERVTRLGPLTAAAKRDFFAGIDVFALPSRSDSFGLVLLEAWANGKPNLVYRAGGPAELIRDGTDGLQAPCGDVAELGAKLSELVSNADLRARLGDNGLSRIAREFRWTDKLELVREVMRSG